jgi:GNAT superfamily N-acetyltransferase
MAEYSIHPVTSIDDIHTLATVFIRATTQKDTFWEMVCRYGSGSVSPFDTLLELLRESFEHPDHHLFKAVHDPTGEVVGMAQWKAPWYLQVEKVDPFATAQDGANGDLNAAALGSSVKELPRDDPSRAAGVASFQDSRRQVRNAYITHIRGKKHVCELSPKRGQEKLNSANRSPVLGRLGVLPEHQKRGIASRLMQWGTDFADDNGLAAFLNGRPEAVRLYEKFGFKTVYVTHFKFDDLEVAPVASMLRLPVPGRKIER